MSKGKLNTPPIPMFRKLMEDTGTKREDLAKALGVSTVAIGQYYNGETLPSIENLIKIADYFNVSTDYLLGRTNIKTTDTTIKGICEYIGLSTKAIECLHVYSAKELEVVDDDLKLQFGKRDSERLANIYKEQYLDTVSILHIISEMIINGEYIFNEFCELFKIYKTASIYRNTFNHCGPDGLLGTYKFVNDICDKMVENEIPYKVFRIQRLLNGFIECLKNEINTNEEIGDLFYSTNLAQYIEVTNMHLEEEVNGKYTGEKK